MLTIRYKLTFSLTFDTSDSTTAEHMLVCLFVVVVK